MLQYLLDPAFDSRHFLQSMRMTPEDASLAVILDRPGVQFTNLDVVTGTVTVHVINSINIANILVKLEGESKTATEGIDLSDGNRIRRVTELHKVLYKVDVVLPPPEVLDPREALTGRHQFTLGPGHYQYRFALKVPLNNTCHADESSSTRINASTAHSKSLLPPSFIAKASAGSTESEAKIHYYVKATIARPSIVRSNIRVILPIEFCPISTVCLQQNSTDEAFARRRHGFPPRESSESSHIYGQGLERIPLPVATHIAVEARMPHPTVIFPNECLPLRISCIVLQGDEADLRLDFVRIQLFALLEIRTRGSRSLHSSNTLLLEQKHLRTPLVFGGDHERTCQLGDDTWRLARVPDALKPSFETCNVTQRYELHIDVGLLQKSRSGHSERIVSELIMPVKLESPKVPDADKTERLKQAAGLSIPSAQFHDVPTWSSKAERKAPQPAEFDPPPSYGEAIASGKLYPDDRHSESPTWQGLPEADKSPRVQPHDPYWKDRQASPS